MKTVLRFKDLEETVVVNSFNQEFTVDGILTEQERTYAHTFFTETAQLIQLDGLHIVHRQVNLTEEFSMEVEHDFPFLKMHFELYGCSSFVRNNKGSKDAYIPNGTHQLMYFPEVKGTLTYPKGTRYTLEILMSLSYLKKILGEDLSVLKSFGLEVKRNQPVKLGDISRPISPAMAYVIMQIVQCKLVGISKKIFVEAKIMELLCLQLECFQTEICPLISVCQKEDVEKLHFVREYLEQHTDQNLSMDQLARLSGLNSFKLKKGFKENFGQTVFGYWTEVKLQKARMMLIEEEMAIAEVSHKIGYKNPQHFTAAFKRHFGFVPSLLKR